MPDALESAPWHDGEVVLQKLMGSAERLAVMGPRIIRPFMPDQHRKFFAQLPFVIMGSVDPQGNCWVGIAAGQPGFVTSPTDRQLDFSTAIDPNDPLRLGIQSESAVGLLGIELHTRRRNRMNGTVTNMNPDGFSVTVGQSFGNCPQYIQKRVFEFSRKPGEYSTIAPEMLMPTDPQLQEMIAKADTFFVSSYVDLDGQRQVDVSHRGGKKGFVRVDADGTLTVPDYAGNRFFNTLGNIIKNPKAGLIFPDFETGDVLQLTGDAEVILESAEIDIFDGAERIWKFRPREIILRPKALPMTWAIQE